MPTCALHSVRVNSISQVGGSAALSSERGANSDVDVFYSGLRSQAHSTRSDFIAMGEFGCLVDKYFRHTCACSALTLCYNALDGWGCYSNFFEMHRLVFWRCQPADDILQPVSFVPQGCVFDKCLTKGCELFFWQGCVERASKGSGPAQPDSLPPPPPHPAPLCPSSLPHLQQNWGFRIQWDSHIMGAFADSATILCRL